MYQQYSKNGPLYIMIKKSNPSEKYQLLQGFLEESNTSPIIETTKLIDLQKKFSMSSNLITDVYGMQRHSFRVISK